MVYPKRIRKCGRPKWKHHTDNEIYEALKKVDKHV